MAVTVGPDLFAGHANAPGQLTDGSPHHLQLTRISQVDMPHSLGLLYEKITAHLVFYIHQMNKK